MDSTVDPTTATYVPAADASGLHPLGAKVAAHVNYRANQSRGMDWLFLMMMLRSQQEDYANSVDAETYGVDESDPLEVVHPGPTMREKHAAVLAMFGQD
jgi:hypothetical protein